MTSATGGLGYADPAYAASLAEFGRPVLLRRSGGWLLDRPIGATGRRDLVGPYPLFACRDWSSLHEDLDELVGSAVSVVVVADPLGGADPALLRRAFPDHVVEYKRHLVVDLESTAARPASHRRRLRLAERSVRVEVSPSPPRHLEDWVALYSQLVERHSVTGVRAFSYEAFRQLLAMPDVLAVCAERDGATVSMSLWLVQGGRAYYHLGASSPAGREVSASYAVFEAALAHLRDRGLRYVDLGATPGSGRPDDGLLRFKRGWAHDERTAYLCGRVLDRVAYAALTDGSHSGRTWFPAYRASDGRQATRTPSRHYP